MEWSTQALEIAQSATEGMTMDQASINALAVVGLLTAGDGLKLSKSLIGDLIV